jgi:transmembrane sensor
MLAAAAAVALAIGVSSFHYSGAHRERPPAAAASESVAAVDHVARGQFETRVGERSTIGLVDGSVITLDTGSRVSLDLGGKTREIHLLAGQANFEVAKDAIRPFVVYAADRRITALGTAFDVRLGPRDVSVTLVEGRVTVDQLRTKPLPGGPDAPLVRTKLGPGEQLVATMGGIARVQGADLQRVTSWREGRLIFESDRLADAIAEVNRYSSTPIVLADPAIGDLRISGVFRTGQPLAFAHALTLYFSIDAAEENGATVLRWRQ